MAHLSPIAKSSYQKHTNPCKPMMILPAINTDASKHEKEQISRTVQEMFEEDDMWLVTD
ncbi:DinI-like family protein [Citrobacter freundii]|nr:DinI-like family protein [Citrobacter freundii]